MLKTPPPLKLCQPCPQLELPPTKGAYLIQFVECCGTSSPTFVINYVKSIEIFLCRTPPMFYMNFSPAKRFEIQLKIDPSRFFIFDPQRPRL